ncbi:MAG TPA: hypothetical protein VFF20_05315 [Pseudogracilibacillus sp.]|nr:hypothetical protein [Pseudogracilibacillus sp.]
MGFKEEIKHTMKNALHDVDLAVTKTWEIPYEDHVIRFENSMKQERLYIDDCLVDEAKHASILSHLKPFSILTGSLEGRSGKTEKVTVKIGGLVKLTIHIKVGNKTILKEKMSVEVLPWEQKKSIVQFIEEQLAEHGRLVDPVLPDIVYLADKDLARIPGYTDQLPQEEPLPFFVKGLIKQLKKLLDQPTVKQRRMIYEKVNDEYISSYGAELLYYLQEEPLNKKRLEEEMLWFLDKAAHREVVKFALVLLSLTDVDAHREKLMTIAKHEEFTMFALIPLHQFTDDAHSLSWELANELSGWGKVAVMQSVDAITLEEKNWFLEQAFNEPAMNEAVALLIAETAELDVLLSNKNISSDTFSHINNVIFSLLQRDEYNNRIIDDYSYAPLVLKQYLALSRQYSEIEALQKTIEAITDFVNDDDNEWDLRYDNGWEVHEREAIIDALQSLND